MCLPGLPISNDSRGSITNCSLSSLSARAANYDFYSGDYGSRDRLWGFYLSHDLVLTTDSTGELLTGCSGGQSIRHWLGN